MWTIISKRENNKSVPSMNSQNRTLLLCRCGDSMKVDSKSAKESLKVSSVIETDLLCTENLPLAEKELLSDNQVIIACEQQATLFKELCNEIEFQKKIIPDLINVDIRDRAGWTDDKNAFAKQAALLSEIDLESPETPIKEITSEGVCLILGKDDIALDVALKLSDELAVTVLLEKELENITPRSEYNLCKGIVKKVSGYLGNYKISVNEYSELNPHGRGITSYGTPKKEVNSECDIIIDLRGSNSLFPNEKKKDGYLRIDPNDKIGLEKIFKEAMNFKGEFEKPVYINFDETKCAHSRASRKGCTRCLDLCPANAITSNGDYVSVDPYICAGCGNCSSVCPSGAAQYNDPPLDFILERIKKLSSTFKKYENKILPRLLFMDDLFGKELISLVARYGKGLPADVIPLNIPNIEMLSHAEILASFACGFSEVLILKNDNKSPISLNLQIEICKNILEASGKKNGDRLKLIETMDPDYFEEKIYDQTRKELIRDPILLVGNKREITRTATKALVGENEEVIKLPDTSPYGEIIVDTNKCTLCLACISLCPTNALEDNADKPELNFTENACIQCGICENTCPEKAIELNPQINLKNDALSQKTLHSEEPFECISCHRPFGVKSTIDRIVSKLENNHWMYQDSKKLDLIKMCDDCRVNAQYHDENSPFKYGEKPKIRTTDDYQ